MEISKFALANGKWRKWNGEFEGEKWYKSKHRVLSKKERD